jgi:hypothetical protein
MTLNEFNAAVIPLLAAIFESHGKPAPSEAVRGLWFSALQPYDVPVVVGALKRYVARPEPSYGVVQPNDIVLLIEGSPEDRSGTAWQKFLAAVRSKSPYLSIAFDDPFIHATVQHLGGWVRLTAEMTEDEREHYRRVFETNYRLFLKQGLPPDTPRRLPGLVENHRAVIGRPYEEGVQLVGNASVAQMVAEGQHPALPARRPALQAASHARG